MQLANGCHLLAISHSPSVKQREEAAAGRERCPVMQPDMLALPCENQEILVIFCDPATLHIALCCVQLLRSGNVKTAEALPVATERDSVTLI